MRETKGKGNFYSVPPMLFEQKLSISLKCVQEIERLMCRRRVVSSVSFADFISKKTLRGKSWEQRMNIESSNEFTHIKRSFNFGKTLILFISSFANIFCEFSFVAKPSATLQRVRKIMSVKENSRQGKTLQRKLLGASDSFERVFLPWHQHYLFSCCRFRSFFLLFSNGWEKNRKVKNRKITQRHVSWGAIEKDERDFLNLASHVISMFG